MVWFSETAMASAPAVRSDLLHLSWRGSCRKLGMNCHPEPRLGIKEVDDGIWLVTFMQYDLGYIDLEQKPCNPSTRSEEHTSELQSLMRNSYAVFCLKKKKTKIQNKKHKQEDEHIQNIKI